MIYAENRCKKTELVNTKAKIAFHKESSERFKELYFLTQLAMIENDLTAEETIEDISIYMKPFLFNTANWLFADFRRLNNFLRTFSIEEAVFLYNRAMKEFEKYKHFSRDNNIQVYLTLNLGQLLADNKKSDQATVFFEQAKKYAEEKNNLFQKLTIEASLEKVFRTGSHSQKTDSFQELLDMLNQISCKILLMY